MNEYFEKIKFVKTKVLTYLDSIFKVYGNELLLRAEEYNLLQNENNCIESSTATGYILEEFIASKLELYTAGNDNIEEVRVERMSTHGTQTKSYDCFVNYGNVFFMINIKSLKKTNDAVAAINRLYGDYVRTNPEMEKSFMVLKTHYSLEEIDFSDGHIQDSRNWSASKFKPESGRLQVSDSFREKQSLPEDEISYEKTKSFITAIYMGNSPRYQG